MRSAQLAWPARALAVLALSATVSGCAGVVTGPSPSPEARREPTASTRPVDTAQAARLQQIMVPLIQAMDNPRPLSEIRVGIIDDPSINAANAGGGEFYVTRGLLEKANDRRLAGVLAHEVAHEDLNHVAKAQVLGAGLNIGMVILDQIFPGTGAITPIAGQLVARGYSRREEYAADAHGVEILRRAGLPKEVMLDTLGWLIQTSGESPGGFFATHPATGDRLDALRQMQ